MDMSNIPAGEIVAPNIDLGPINQGIKDRAFALSSQMNPEAAAQFENDMSALECSVQGEGSSVKFSLRPSNAYLIQYLKDHGTPVTGGDDGTAHNVDGSTYSSDVPPERWGIELPWLELPHLDGEEEAVQIVKLLGPDAAISGVSNSSDALGEAAKPIVEAELQNYLGGGSS